MGPIPCEFQPSRSHLAPKFKIRLNFSPKSRQKHLQCVLNSGNIGFSCKFIGQLCGRLYIFCYLRLEVIVIAIFDPRKECGKDK